MRLPSLITLCTICFLQIGCGPQSPIIAPSDLAPADAPELPQVAHPEYTHWSRFPIGTKVIRYKEAYNDHGKVKVTTTITLADKSEKQVVVESQITVERENMPAEVNPSFTAEYPATFPLPANLKLEQFTLPSLKAKVIGEENQSVAGKDFATTIYGWQEVNEAGPMDVKVWRSDDVPGRTVREESLTISTQNKSLETVIEISIPEPTK
jgi:hypothetical protein